MELYIKLIKMERTWLPNFKGGWGNGYVCISKEHPFYGVHCDHIPVDVHGGLTYGGMEANGFYCVGFDTAHIGDTLEEWPLLAVEGEALNLYDQMVRLGKTWTREQVEQRVRDLDKQVEQDES